MLCIMKNYSQNYLMKMVISMLMKMEIHLVNGMTIMEKMETFDHIFIIHLRKQNQEILFVIKLVFPNFQSTVKVLKNYLKLLL